MVHGDKWHVSDFFWRQTKPCAAIHPDLFILIQRLLTDRRSGSFTSYRRNIIRSYLSHLSYL